MKPYEVSTKYIDSVTAQSFTCEALGVYGIAFVVSCTPTEMVKKLFPWIPKEKWVITDKDGYGGVEGLMVVKDREEFLRLLVCFGLSNKSLETMQENVEARLLAISPEGAILSSEELFTETNAMLETVMSETLAAVKAACPNQN